MFPTPPTVIDHLADDAHHGGPWDGAQCIVIHHTGGTNSLDWLSTNPNSRVSVQRLIAKDGTIYRIVPDGENAWHVGGSNIGEHTIASGDDGSANEICFGIELENLGTGEDPYPDAQIDSCGWQVATWWIAHTPLPIVTHKLIDTHDKIDPAGLDLTRVYRAALRWYDHLVETQLTRYTVNSRLLAGPKAAQLAVYARFPAPRGDYSAYDIRSQILPAYWRLCVSVDLDPVLAIAQMAHETGYLTSFWSQRPQRNPAGIGVIGPPDGVRPADQPQPMPHDQWRMNTQRQRWERGLSFPKWEADAIPAHVGRLLAYAIPAGEGTDQQRQLILRALAIRPLGGNYRGVAPTLQGLESTWADPGELYADSLARVANDLAGV